jgi:hypothetical protein
MGMENRDLLSSWRGVGIAILAVSAVATAIVIAIVMHPRMKPQKLPQIQASVRTPAAVRPQQAARPQAAIKPQVAARPLTEAERKVSEELWAEQKKLDTDGARVVSASSDGRRRVAETIAKQFDVPEKVVTDLRGRKLAYGDITAALALSQQMMKRDKVTRQQALDNILAARKSGQGWAALARDRALKLAAVVGEVKKTDKQLAKVLVAKAAR